MTFLGDPDQSVGSESGCTAVRELKAGDKVFVKLSTGNVMVNAISSHLGFTGFKIN